MALRQIISILILPFTVTVLVPYWLTGSFGASDTRWADDSVLVLAIRAAGLLVFLAGIFLFAWCVSLFWRVGRGTLAPWDPTKNLVASGPYRWMRNPMITGVATILAGEALFRGSWLTGAWACIFIALNHFYFILSEEPGLEKRFGESYIAYKRTTPRWLPLRWSSEKEQRLD